jgi:phosphatidylglycerophosphate synthase
MNFRLFFPNFLSILRILLIPLVFILNENFRFPILVVAGFSDLFDGYLARKWHTETSFGAVIDPIGDKALAITYSVLYFREGVLDFFQLGALFARDAALLVFLLYLFMKGSFSTWKIRSFYSGKMATLFQGLVFICITLHCSPPSSFYYILYSLGFFSLFELLFLYKRSFCD